MGDMGGSVPPQKVGLLGKSSNSAIEETFHCTFSTAPTFIQSEYPSEQLAGRRWGRCWRSGRELARLRAGGK